MQLAIDFDSRRLARRTDPETSHKAAQRVCEFSNGQHKKIIDALSRIGQAGAEQIAAEINLDPYSVRKRTSELYRKGLIKLTGETRLTVSGRHERVWSLT